MSGEKNEIDGPHTQPHPDDNHGLDMDLNPDLDLSSPKAKKVRTEEDYSASKLLTATTTTPSSTAGPVARLLHATYDAAKSYIALPNKRDPPATATPAKAASPPDKKVYWLDNYYEGDGSQETTSFIQYRDEFLAKNPQYDKTTLIGNNDIDKFVSSFTMPGGPTTTNPLGVRLYTMPAEIKDRYFTDIQEKAQLQKQISEAGHESAGIQLKAHKQNLDEALIQHKQALSEVDEVKQQKAALTAQYDQMMAKLDAKLRPKEKEAEVALKRLKFYHTTVQNFASDLVTHATIRNFSVFIGTMIDANVQAEDNARPYSGPYGSASNTNLNNSVSLRDVCHYCGLDWKKLMAMTNDQVDELLRALVRAGINHNIELLRKCPQMRIRLTPEELARCKTDPFVRQRRAANLLGLQEPPEVPPALPQLCPEEDKEPPTSTPPSPLASPSQCVEDGKKLSTTTPNAQETQTTNFLINEEEYHALAPELRARFDELVNQSKQRNEKRKRDSDAA